jgi:hypothetical protein
MADDVQWLRELEQSTKNSMMKLNSRAKSVALKRSESDLSVHKWAQLQSVESPVSTPHLMSSSRQETTGGTPQSSKRRKRPLSSESSFTAGAR